MVPVPPNPLNAKLLYATALSIEEHPESHDQGTWGRCQSLGDHRTHRETVVTKISCGTTGCIAFHMAIAAGRPVRVTSWGSVYDDTTGDLFPVPAYQLGIDPDFADDPLHNDNAYTLLMTMFNAQWAKHLPTTELPGLLRAIADAPTYEAASRLAIKHRHPTNIRKCLNCVVELDLDADDEVFDS